MSEELNNVETTNNETLTNDVAAPAEGNTNENVQPTVAETAPVQDANPSENAEEKAKIAAEKAKNVEEKANRLKHIDEVINELQAIKDKGEAIEVKIDGRKKGGLRVIYKDVELFLPASHFSLRKSVSEAMLEESLGTTMKVLVHEIQAPEKGRRSVILSRKDYLANTVFDSIKVGDVVKGKIISVTDFGVFVDVNGAEGLIHISRLSHTRIDNPHALYKVGDEIESKITGISKEKLRIELSRKAIEPSAWDSMNDEFKVGETYPATVKKILDYGLIAELKPGIEALLRIGEMSWTKRIKTPADLFAVGEEIKVYVMDLNVEKKSMTLSYKRTFSNPWETITEKFPVGTPVSGTVSQKMDAGIIVSFDEFDAFMPSSRLALTSQKFNIGDAIEAKISDINKDKESLIVEPANQDAKRAPRGERPNRERRENEPRFDRPRRDFGEKVNIDPAPTISLFDVLNKDTVNMLNKIKEEGSK